jgi:hypothetical protein
MSSFLCLVLDVLGLVQQKLPIVFSKANVWLRGGLDSFSQNNTRTNKENVWLWRFVC